MNLQKKTVDYLEFLKQIIVRQEKEIEQVEVNVRGKQFFRKNIKGN